MRFTRKLLAAVLIAVFIYGLFGSMRTKAEEICKPKIALKYVNKKTGVKIIIDKTPEADAYSINIKGCGTSYLDYSTDYKKDSWRKLALFEKNGNAKRTYTIKGLPKGTYTIRVEALQKFVDNGYPHYSEIGYSEEKKITIKAPKTLKTKEKKYDFSKVKVGDTITFGAYEQDDIMTNGKEDIEWIVLSKTKSEMLVVSKYALDCLPYNNKYADITWEKCTLRKWLNSNFYKSAFTKAEKNMIKKTVLKNVIYSEYEIDVENDTEDKIFLLSLDDMENSKYGFDDNLKELDIARRCAPTVYAVMQGVDQSYSMSMYNYYKTTEGESSCIWWLRSQTAHVEYSGDIDYHGFSADIDYFGVRPSIVIKLE